MERHIGIKNSPVISLLYNKYPIHYYNYINYINVGNLLPMCISPTKSMCSGACLHMHTNPNMHTLRQK